jgi:hypothetical protein
VSPNDLRPGYGRYNVGWYRVADAKKPEEMCVDIYGQKREFSVPPVLARI